MDYKNDPWNTSQIPKNRCIPSIFASQKSAKIISTNDINKNLINAFNNNQIINCPINKKILLSPYATKPLNGFCDWCSGKNMHFDIQDKEIFNKLTSEDSGSVIKYERIKCENPYPLPPFCNKSYCKYGYTCGSWNKQKPCKCYQNNTSLPKCPSNI